MDISPLIISLKTSIPATIISLLVAVFLIYLVKFKFSKSQNLIECIINIPLVLPPSVIGFILLFIFGKNSVVGQFFDKFGVDIIFTIYASIIASIIVSLPLMYRSIIVSVDEIDKTILEEASLVGCNNFQILKLIILPISKNGIMSGVVMAFLRSLGEFGATLIVSGNIPNVTENIANRVYFATITGRANEAFFWSVLLILISFFAIFFLNRNKN